MKKIFPLILGLALIAACAEKGKTADDGPVVDAVVASDRVNGPVDSLTLMIHWTPQAQFAGYYMALEKGFYQEEGIKVKLVDMVHASEGDAFKSLTSGKADLCTSLLQHALLEKSWGSDIVNVLQVSQNTGLVLVSHKPVESFKDLEKMRIGRWKQGFGEIADIFYHENKLDVTPIDFTQGSNLYLCGALDATLCEVYNEYLEILFAEGDDTQSHILKFSELGYNYPEDAVFATKDYYEHNASLIVRFNRATIKGWNYARSHREETIDVVIDAMKRCNVPCNRKFQTMMLDQVLELQIDKGTGTATFSPITEEAFNKMENQMIAMGHFVEYIDYKDFIK